ncbi:(S)-coclaurine N-methyltransferase isoform X2 [Sesamum indicum]|uniref:(S)-coclaurine N-methyltransferase isoform X2 n=1 Tax=Sesamum indicum TaxID=4182 RepID=A0A6I9TL08_SESIN|nr:(S)-coclaurine N-methyltransferase isoform X2 [Sesamum indicum]
MAEVNGRIIDTIVQMPYDATVRFMLASLERNLLPDAVVRRLTRLLLASRLRSGYRSSAELQLSDLLQFAHSLREMPIAIKTEKPKSQHYEVPTSYFKLVLGKHLKYSCCFFPNKSSTLEDAEKAMLELYCERSQIKDGQSVLDVGCGWGSLSIYIAQKYPNCQVTGICNSITQKAHIEEQCRELQLQNVEIIVADISTFDMEASYDRIFSIEMFEDVNEDDWITRYFFTGGTMPSANLLLYFQDDVSIVNHWLVNGKHYAQTSEEWLKRMDQNLNSIKPIMECTYGKDSAVKWTVYWRTFFIAVAELFGYNNGEEWMVAHFLFKKK